MALYGSFRVELLINYLLMADLSLMTNRSKTSGNIVPNAIVGQVESRRSGT